MTRDILEEYPVSLAEYTVSVGFILSLNSYFLEQVARMFLQVLSTDSQGDRKECLVPYCLAQGQGSVSDLTQYCLTTEKNVCCFHSHSSSAFKIMLPNCPDRSI